jgi:hypothetical protein
VELGDYVEGIVLVTAGVQPTRRLGNEVQRAEVDDWTVELGDLSAFKIPGLAGISLTATRRRPRQPHSLVMYPKPIPEPDTMIEPTF